MQMKLSVKMTALFSVMMLAALAVLSSFALKTSIAGATSFTESRFNNMAVAIRRDLEQDIAMMELTMNSLIENPSFLAALNQMIRDDTADHKVGQAATQLALQQLYQSPMVDNYYRVSFYTREGLFLSSLADKGSSLVSGSEETQAIVCALPWLDQADSITDYLILSPHADVFFSRDNVQVYGIVQRVLYHGNSIGYLEISKEYKDLERIMGFVDNPAVIVQAVFDDGRLLFSSIPQVLNWPADLASDSYTTTPAGPQGEDYNVLYEKLDKLHLHLYIAQNAAVDRANNSGLRLNMFRTMLCIMAPTVILIGLVSFGLTSSTRRLTKKVRLFPTDSVLRNDPALAHDLSCTVSAPRDKEIYELEKVFNAMMLRLQKSASTELSLREGALQAQLSALQAQINPHFVYNTLNIISARAMESGAFEIIEICDQFAQMLRYSTDTRSRTSTLAEEIDNVRNYLLLAKARYEKHLEFSIDVPEQLGGLALPKLTLQPLVENALTHGFNGQNVVRRLAVTGWLDGQLLRLEIRDNGTGFSEEMLQNLQQRMAEIDASQVGIQSTGGHIGLLNTCLRLHYYSKGQMRISIRNDGGAVVTLTMPRNASFAPEEDV